MVELGNTYAHIAGLRPANMQMTYRLFGENIWSDINIRIN